MIEHLTELLELILCLLSWCSTLFLSEHALEGVKICSIFDEPRDVDLGTDEVAEVASGVKKRRLHEQVHERRAITSAVDCLTSRHRMHESNTY